jgi:hypothetical protein
MRYRNRVSIQLVKEEGESTGSKISILKSGMYGEIAKS